MVKAYGLTPDYVLNNMSYANMLLYGAVLPSYDPKKKRDKGKGGSERQKVIKADDRANREEVRRFFETCE